MLKKLKIEQEYRTDGIPPVNFYINCLEASNRFDRSAGFFSSSGISAAAQGFANFVNNRGKIRLVVSPEFSREDIEAIVSGYKQREDVVQDCMIRSIESIKDGIEKDRFEALSWLIANNRLDIKIAITLDENGNPSFPMYHEKMGIFYDDNNDIVAFSGSSNETRSGWVDNFESIDVFKSWENSSEEERVAKKKKNFEKLWNNGTKFLDVKTIPSAVKDIIVKNAPQNSPKKEEKIIIDEFFNDDNDNSINYPDWLKEKGLRPYQREMVKLWVQKKRKGIFSMATGTGKTITSLAAATDLFYETGKLLIVVCCPNTALVNQWQDEAENFNFNPVIAMTNYNKWAPKVRRARKSIEKNVTNIEMIIATSQSMFSKSNRLFSQLEGSDFPILFIADEVHNLGTKNTLKMLPRNLFDYKIGLTATPNRYFDEKGTKELFKYFGEPLPIDPPVDLEYAIKNNYLCEYNYYPRIVFLTDDETEEYHEITLKINKLMNWMDPEEPQLQRLFEKRVGILNNAVNKIDALNEVLLKKGDFTKSLFFCSPDQIDEISSMLVNEHNYHVKRITYNENAEEKKRIIKEFGNKTIDALCAISVVDEGLDVPATENAFFLSSTGNQKQFIQRRGRVLRKSEGKTIANIYDFIVIPNGNFDENTNIVKKALERELDRFSEFCVLAKNNLEAKEVLLKIALENDIII
tara:strand:+ start:890 stop:2965 length:2076 start_codon:yes stop_codon:yes gene_type:complete